MVTREVVVLVNLLVFVQCGYPPIGDEVIPGSVLLPATRRGRYLANIVRRQAVDGTGIKFNKDADRMNAEAKKKVDVLSEELLPYIIAEQERRTTLYKRVMTAIQNGEKGATVAEIRNKPPLIIRKGLMFRCPANRAPKEPDGSGIIMCEGDIEPTPVMYDSCLSAEDKDLYVAENKYFFCNRHKVEGPDLPRNGTTVIGCAPTERTSLNYTNSKCTLEDTDDVVVHYRYYPDRTYKFVTELDPDREVCDHWNPCQIGYIFSLPSADQAIPANELWHDYVDRFEESERDEIVPPIAEDTLSEHVPTMGSGAQDGDAYDPGARRVRVPNGYTFEAVWRVKDPHGSHARSSLKVKTITTKEQKTATGNFVVISVKVQPFKDSSYGDYYAVFVKTGGGKEEAKKDGRRHSEKTEKSVHFLTLERTDVYMERKTVVVMPGKQQDPENMEYRCRKCRVAGIMVRNDDGLVFNLSPDRWRSLDGGDSVKRIQIDVSNARPKDFGTYMVRVYGDSGEELLVQSLKMEMPSKDPNNSLKTKLLRLPAQPGDKIDNSISYECSECEVIDITCNGQSAVEQSKAAIVPGAKTLSFNIPSFTDDDACVYMAVFKKGDKAYSKILAIIDNASPAVSVDPADSKATAPKDGEPFQHTIHLHCDDGDCRPQKVSVNGIELEPGPTRRMFSIPMAYFQFIPGIGIMLYIEPFSWEYIGCFMGVFLNNGVQTTKVILDIKSEDDEAGGNDDDSVTQPPEGNNTDMSTAINEDSSHPVVTEAPEGGDTTKSEDTTKADEPIAETTAPPE